MPLDSPADDHPFVLDEVIDGINVLVRGKADLAMDVVNIKISKFGGLTKARQARDLCVSLGIAMTIEDSWGGDITTAAIATWRTARRGILVHFHGLQQLRNREHGRRRAHRADGRMAASTRPGLGITPKMDILGQPVLVVE